MKIKITADRMIDFTEEELKRRDIAVMSCFINMGGESYEDMIDITPDDIFAHLKKTGELAKTAAKSPDAYYEFFKPFTGEGKGVLHFAASKGVSCICENSILASQRLPNVYVVDTRSLSGGAALLADYAEELIKKGEKLEKIHELCVAKRDKLQTSFLIDTMECVHKAGRCSSLTYFAANLLKIKPVISLDKETGKMYPREKLRGNIRKVMVEYIENTFKKYPNPDTKAVYISHYCKDEELVKYFVDTVAKYQKFDNVYVNIAGCNCSLHSGPDTFGLFYLVK